MPGKQRENYFCGREYCTGDHIDAGRYCHGNPEAASPNDPLPDITKVMGEDGKSAVYCKACELEAKDGIELGDFCHNCKAPAVAGRTQGDEG